MEIEEDWGPFTTYEPGSFHAVTPLLPLLTPEMVGVEIGCLQGDSSRYLLKKCKHMYFIDPFRKYAGFSDNTILDVVTKRIDPNAVCEVEADLLAEEFLAKMKWIKPEGFTFLREMSDTAVNKIPMVDFVFVDGNHTTSACLTDLRNYWPKINPNGYLAGHDWHRGDIQHAVYQFAHEKQLQFYVQGEWNFYFQKGAE